MFEEKLKEKGISTESSSILAKGLMKPSLRTISQKLE
jgi:hypothetical protein